MVDSWALKFPTLFLVSAVSSFSNSAPIESIESIPFNVISGFDGNPVWIGVQHEVESDSAIEWSVADSRVFSIDISESTLPLPVNVVLLKRDSVPVIESLTIDSTNEPINVEFLDGASVSGTLVDISDGSPISEGLITVRFDETLDIPLPEDSSVFAWELEKEGMFEIQGLPTGKHTVSVLAPGYMPAEQQVLVESVNQKHELHFQLPKAKYIHGHIVDYKYRSRIEGTFEVSVFPAESQTAEVKTEFDSELNFKLGPFAESAVVELVAQTANELRSRTIEASVPTDELVVYVHQWIRVTGTVIGQDTGTPISEFMFVTGRRQDEVSDIFDLNGQFSMEICDEFPMVSIHAQGYAYWASEEINFGLDNEDEIVLGDIKLDPVFTVQGTVLDQQTGKPIQGAKVFRNDTMVRSRRASYIATWNSGEIQTTTNNEGEFNLTGFPSEGSHISVMAPGYLGQSQPVEDINLLIEFELVPSTMLSGQVVSITGDPVEASVNCLGYGGKRTDNGKFQFNLGEGTYQFQAVADSGTSEILEITVARGQTIEGVRLIIENIGRIYGNITGLLEKETARVSVKGVVGSTAHNISNGTFELTGITSEGSHIIHCLTNLGRELNETVVIDASLEGNVDLSFTGSSSLSGRLVADSVGLPDFDVQIRPEDPSLPSVKVRSKRNGSYRFEGLVDGNYVVEVPSRNFAQHIVVQGDTYSDLHLSANRLYGKLRSNVLENMNGAEVILKGTTETGEEVSLWSKVNKDGSYEFDNIPAGTYTVRITHPVDYIGASQEFVVDQTSVEQDFYLDELTNELE